MGGSRLKEENGTSMGMAERRSGWREDEHEREYEHEHEHEHDHEQCPCPSTSDEDDPGLRPSQLYGKFTWKIENFSQISKRELRSNVFEVGGYKWYILVYPQGCDVCNHLSLFLCVADYDKLLPGWSHFAQFTIAVVNKDPKKSKYSDTLHRFCKKEHDWGWKKFMEVSKVLDGFTMADTLVIKAQVQVIRENPHRPFRCLDCQYRRELVRVYITNVEAICRRFVEEKREKLAKLREDTAKWSSFRTFWLAVDEDEQRRMSREKTDVILKQVVKRFFNEKEVTSTLVMDALYSGYKALECQSANNKGKSRSMDPEDISSPVVCVEKDVFVLADDVLSLLERASTEPLPPLKDDKGPQNRTKDGGSGDDFGRESVDCDEKCLTELGRRTVEMFVLAHLYSNHVEMAYQRDVSIKMQEELIREEEAASHAEIEQRAKREAADKEKRSKKKQAKQRRRTPKEKDRVRNDNGDINAQHQHQHQQEILSVIRNVDASSSKESSLPVLEILGTPDEGDLSGMDKTDNVVGIIGPETEDGDLSRVDWDRDSSEMQQDMEASFSGSLSVSEQSAQMGRKQRHALDDSSSTCSTDSLASVAMNGSYKGNSSYKCESLSTRGKNKSNSEWYGTNSGTRAGANMVAISALEVNNNISKSSSNEEVLTLRQQVQWLEQRIVVKDDEISLLKNKLSSYQEQIDCDKPSKQQDMTACHCHTRNTGLSSSRSVDDDDDEHKSSCVQADDSTLKYGSSCSPGELQVKCSLSKDLHTESGKMEGSNLTLKKTNPLSQSVSFKHNMKETVPPTSRSREIDQSAKSATTAPIESDEMLRPSSAPLIPAVPRSNIPAVLTPSVPLLARSISAAGRLDSGVDPLTSSNLSLSRSPSVSPSYRNAAAGKMKGTSSGHFPPVASSVAPTGVCVTQSPPSSLCMSSPNPYKANISCPESLGRIRENGSSSSSTCIPSLISTPQSTMSNGFAKDHSPVGGVEQSASHMGFTFGTIPELLHRNRPRELQELSGVEDHRQQQRFLEHCVSQQQRKSQNMHANRFQSEQDNLGLRFPQSCPDDLASQGLFKSMNSRNVVRHTGAVMGEDFPHLDMIDDLLDEEQSWGKVALSTKLQNPGEQILNGQFYLPGFHGPKIDLYNGSGLERYMPEEDSTLQMACPSDWSSSGQSESMQVLPPYAHSSPSQYYDQYNGQLEEVLPHNWSMYSADMPQKSFMNNGHGSIASPMGNSIQGHHYSAGHCSNFSLGPNGYTFF